MRSHNNGLAILLSLLLVVILTGMLGSDSVRADDVDVYKTTAKNGAMLVIDNSGSMSWPVFDSTFNYANFMKWMIDQSLATDLDNSRDGATWWDNDDSGDDYDRLDPDQIYLVSSYVGHDLITYTDSNGDTQQVSAIGDVMWRTGSGSSNHREEWLQLTIVELKNSGGENWKLPAAVITDTGVVDDGTPSEIAISTTIETVTVTEDGQQKYYVVFPNTTVGTDAEAVTNDYAGQRLANAQDVLLTNKVTDPRTGTVTDQGFLGALRTSGYYFSGFFEHSGAEVRFTDSKSNWESDRVYIFATGKWLNFIKLVEDFEVVGSGTAWYNYSFQEDLAWRNICDKSAGTTEPSYTSQSTTITSHDTEYNDYPNTPTGDFDRGSITPPGTVVSIKVRFDYIDTDPCGSGTANDYVDIQDANGNSLLAIKGQEIYAGSAGSGAAVSTDGGQTWTSSSTILDSDGYTQAINADSIRVVWHNGSVEGCSGYDRGFKVTGFKYTAQAGGEAGNFLCLNGDDGYGNKIRSRMDVAKAAMKRVVGDTRDVLRWGLTDFNSSPRVRKTLGSDPDQVLAAIDALLPSGGTPLGKALQDAYDDSNYDYYENSTNASEAECAAKYIIAMTDGFPTGDDDWDRISTSKDGNPHFDNTSNTYVDDDYDNHSDDVAYWLHHEATHKHTVHSIGFGLDNPLLGDMADSSAGIYVTANNEGQLVDAFYSLSLAMTESQSFVAPVVSVDQANRTQSGDELYTAFFQPREGRYWVGNLKKYGIKLLVRADCGRTQSEFVVVGDDGTTPVTDCFGNFLSTATSTWSKVPDGGDVTKGGVGALLKDAMPGTHSTNVPSSGPYYDFRNIYGYDTSGGTIERFIHDNFTNTELGVSADSDRNKIINFVYGYTYDAESDGDPRAKRDWILGDVIHSEPTVIDYLDENNGLKHRFIVIGANDGMLHVFTDQDITLTNAAGTATSYEAGSEIWAFIPADLLTKLQEFGDPSEHEYFVDGFSSLHRARTFNDDNTDSQRGIGEYFHKTLVFGERRGGNSYWSLDVSKPVPSQWTVQWHIQGGQGDDFDEISQTWSKPAFARIQTGGSTFKDVVIFTGGYDPEEDGFPEAWTDDDQDGVKDSGESYTDTAGGTASSYDYYNPAMNELGRGIFVVDLANGTKVFRATYGSSTTSTGTTQAYPEMKWSFPADHTVVPLNFFRSSNDFGFRKLVIYAGDVYTQIWKVVYTFDDIDGAKWEVSQVFTANPGSNQTGAEQALSQAPSTVASDWGRKMFYGPDVSYLGTSWTDDPVLYFGTGDRPHPRYVAYDAVSGNGYHDRFYVVADTDDPDDPIDETSLLNLTCDELENAGDVNQNGQVSPDDTQDDTLRGQVRDILFGLTDYPIANKKARGWYRIMGKQGDCTQDSLDHVGEKVLSRPTLFFKIVYFTTYKPKFTDPCNPAGDAIIYALDYADGTAAFDFDPATGSGDEVLSDTHTVVQDSTIASGVRVITREGRAAGVFSAGGALVGVGVSEGTGPTTTIPGPPGGAAKMLWDTW